MFVIKFLIISYFCCLHNVFRRYNWMVVSRNKANFCCCRLSLTSLLKCYFLLLKYGTLYHHGVCPGILVMSDFCAFVEIYVSVHWNGVQYYWIFFNNLYFMCFACIYSKFDCFHAFCRRCLSWIWFSEQNAKIVSN